MQIIMQDKSQEKFWDIHVYDGRTTHHFRKFGTYSKVQRVCESYPSTYRWTIH